MYFLPVSYSSLISIRIPVIQVMVRTGGHEVSTKKREGFELLQMQETIDIDIGISFLNIVSVSEHYLRDGGIMALINRIKYDAPSDDVVVWKYPREDIRLGSQLIVHESQDAIFLKGGKVFDVFSAGTHTLSSANIPLLTKFINLPFGGDTPFSAEVYYINRTVKRDLKWGTKGALQVIDPIYNYPVSVRAFGRWGMKINDSKLFLTEIVGTQSRTSSSNYIDSERIEEYFIGEIVQRLSTALGKYFIEQGVSVFQASARLNDLSIFLNGDLIPTFQKYGIELANFNVERISIPQEEQKKFQDILGKRMEIEQISQANVSNTYAMMRSFDTLDKVAENEGGGAGQLLSAGLGVGVGLGAGVPMGQSLSSNVNVNSAMNNDGDELLVKLKKLKQLLEADLISKDDFEKKKAELLDSI